MGLYDRERDCVANDKWVAHCLICKNEFLKKKTTTILAKRQYTNPKTVGHICDECLCRLLDKYEISTDVSM